MGIESFSVTLRAARSEPIERVARELESYPHFKPRGGDARGQLYEYDDGQCIIEALLRGSDQEAEFDLCVRFALANRDIVQQRFIEFIKWTIDRWHPQLWQMSSVAKEKTAFSFHELDDFLERFPSELDTLRTVWEKAFGPKRGRVRVEDVYRWLSEAGDTSH